MHRSDVEVLKSALRATLNASIRQRDSSDDKHHFVKLKILCRPIPLPEKSITLKWACTVHWKKEVKEESRGPLWGNCLRNYGHQDHPHHFNRIRAFAVKVWNTDIDICLDHGKKETQLRKYVQRRCARISKQSTEDKNQVPIKDILRKQYGDKNGMRQQATNNIARGIRVRLPKRPNFLHYHVPRWTKAPLASQKTALIFKSCYTIGPKTSASNITPLLFHTHFCDFIIQKQCKKKPKLVRYL